MNKRRVELLQLEIFVDLAMLKAPKARHSSSPVRSRRRACELRDKGWVSTDEDSFLAPQACRVASAKRQKKILFIKNGFVAKRQAKS
jgi:hypothetical protein